MPLAVRRHEDAGAFLDRAEPWLLEREVENNLILGIAMSLRGGTADPERPPYLATVEDDGRVVGCAWRTPPHKVGLTRMPVGAAAAVARDVSGLYDALPGVLGPDEVAAGFAAAWSDAKGVIARMGMRQRIYALESVVPPPNPPAGRLRTATSEDTGLLSEWVEMGSDETGHVLSPQGKLKERVAAGDFFVWEDGVPRCMAGIAARTPNGVRVGYVYTPPEHRRRGYASACTAALSQHALDAGARFCSLYTDRDNPTSNAIYAAIGYQPVCDAVDFEFEDVS